MPELPEVETVMRGLHARLQNRRIVSFVQRRPDLRFPLPPGLAGRLTGRVCHGFRRRAKYILVDLRGGPEAQTLILHLGMSGRLSFDGAPAGAHEHLTFGFDDGTVLRFVDPRRFGMLDLVPTAASATHRWLAHLGLEPLAPGFDGPALARLLAGRLQPVKTAIMDQRLVVGVGNIYASESLHRAGVSPRRLAANVGPGRAAALSAAIVEVLEQAITAGGSSLRDYVRADGQLGNFQSFFRVYDRAGEPCGRCGGAVVKLVQGGRATYFCGRCQR
ncbi:MAG: bifunctional DNA-formamidopyrimidine glycosylase/DNA-(apurinic or apyrimidinic site) lyase [Geminicoccaceae bacterium]|nr:bifunctional DNA-formamidopyrimidine glycosylase/DNA-(apurinic or apyrimidinic site) lyase [Geminicoccaceae bacterium]